MDPCEPTLASCEAQPALCKTKVLHRPATVSSNETNLALFELATAPIEANLALRQVRDESLNSASCEAKIVFDCETISALNRVKVEAHSTSEAKAEARSTSEAKAKGMRC